VKLRLTLKCHSQLAWESINNNVLWIPAYAEMTLETVFSLILFMSEKLKFTKNSNVPQGTFEMNLVKKIKY